MVTVVIPTRNRGARLAAAIDSVLACGGPTFALIVIDQSIDSLTEEAVRPYVSSRSVLYVRTTTTGVAAARNLGVAHARTPLVAFTDDDCVVKPGWLAELTQTFAMLPRVAIVFGNVLEGPHDPSQMFVISYHRKGVFLGRSVRDKHRIDGIAGSMAVRVSAWSSLGGFDEMLGSGSRFRSAEELDFALRALQSGYEVCETDRAAVVHHGWQDRSDKNRIAYDYLYGIGATFGKHLKCRRWSVFRPLGHLARRWMFGIPVVGYGSAPSKRARMAGFLTGFFAGMMSPVDVRQALYSKGVYADLTLENAAIRNLPFREF